MRNHQYDKAEAIFYKAYLYDPADPFTLNNLGYISELQGELERAQKFYSLASQQGSNAFIDTSSAKSLEGKPMMEALNGIQDMPMRVNRMNIQAIDLLQQGRNSEAQQLLQKALSLDSNNPFTQNNLGVAEEGLGNFEQALKYYDQASGSSSSDVVVVTLNRSWRGKPASEMATENARKLTARMQKLDVPEARAALLAFRGVSAINRNDWSTARKDFLEAYSLNPYSAFSLNNLGYVSERDGDMETAAFFYDRARKADNANARIGLASQSSAQGKHLLAVAADSGEQVDGEIDRYTQSRRQLTEPVQLKRREDSTSQPNVPPSSPVPHQ
ncbi:tetratricopeptide repeat protein [Acidobacterium sp. S8]|uniref:tetratricopeptide repeat protein n=1 Tax=Acidobacterium sp. S8 TaxID=1641854 RepID=UPI00131B4C01|nr:tetratricopeptide repeat protein [Acidobacterium sp. S8]